MTDWAKISEIAAGPIVGLFSGVAGTLLGLKKRMEDVEGRIKAHAERVIGLNCEIKELREQDEDLIKANEALREELRNTYDRVRESSEDFAGAAVLANFMTEQEEQWKLMQRTMGQIEGFLGMGQPPQAVPQRAPPRPTPRPMQRPPSLAQAIQVHPNLNPNPNRRR